MSRADFLSTGGVEGLKTFKCLNCGNKHEEWLFVATGERNCSNEKFNIVFYKNNYDFSFVKMSRSENTTTVEIDGLHKVRQNNDGGYEEIEFVNSPTLHTFDGYVLSQVIADELGFEPELTESFLLQDWKCETEIDKRLLFFSI